MKLEVGKKYICRDVSEIEYVEVVKIERCYTGVSYVGRPVYKSSTGGVIGLIDYYSDGSFCDPVESRLDLVAEYREEEKSMSKYSIEEFRNTYFRKPKDVEECELYRKWFKDNTDVEVSNCLHESRMLTYVGHQYSGVDLNVLMFRSSEGVMPLRYIDIDRYMYNTPIKKEVKAMTLEEQLQEAENKVAEIKKQISNIPKKYEVELYVEFTDQDLGGSLISYLGFRRWNLTKFAPGGRKVKITIEEIKEN